MDELETLQSVETAVYPVLGLVALVGVAIAAPFLAILSTLFF